MADQELVNLGRLLARIHNQGSSKPCPNRITLNGAAYSLEPLAFLQECGFIPAQFRQRYARAVQEIALLYDTLTRDVPYHRIHGDCHLGNLLQGSAGWFFLDFDDFLAGPAVQDIWMLVPARDTEGLRQRQVLLEGYCQFREFNQSWLRLIELLRGLRYIHYAAWIARRWEDPAFPVAFPHFGTDQYWEDTTNDLEEQLIWFYAHEKELPDGIKPGIQLKTIMNVSNSA